MRDSNDIDLTCINTIRTLAIDAIQASDSGHPGTPMDAAPVAYCLWQQLLRFDPQDPVAAWSSWSVRRSSCRGWGRAASCRSR